MRNILFASAAVTALLAGPAVAQNAPESQRNMPGMSAQQQAPKGSAREEQAPKAGPQSSERREGAQSGERREGKRESTGSSQPSPMKAQGEDRTPSGQKPGTAEMKKDGSSPSAQPPRNSNAEKSGTSEMRKEPSAPKASSSTQRNERERSTTGQSPSGQQMKGDRANQNAPAAQRGETGMDQKPGTSGTVNQGNQAGQRDPAGRTQGSAAPTPEVQSKFSEVIEKQKVKSVTDVNVSISVGSTIPSSVHVYDVPRDIVTIYPQYRGKKFVVVRDEIVIIEPGTRKIVSVIPRSGRTTTGTASSLRHTSSKLQLAPEKRRVIRETVIKEQAAPRCADLQVSVGQEVPRSIQLRPFPDVIVEDVPEIRSYRFCIRGDDVVLIDPSEYRIVEIIE